MAVCRLPSPAWPMMVPLHSNSVIISLAEATRIGDLYAELFKDAYKPFETVGVKTK